MDHTGIEYWKEKLSNSEMPVLSNVVSVLNKLTGDDTAEFKQLAEVILKDPHLTTQILKLANSVQYNPSGNSISTISRAIVILGFRKVRTMCISLMVVDSLLSKQPKERLLATMGKAFFAAVQAKEIYKRISHNPTEQEEVFIAGLLFNLGEMVFWAYGGKSADNLDVSLMECMKSNSNFLIEKELGTSFKSLSRELTKSWNLGELLQTALSSKGFDTKTRLGLQAQAVMFGDLLSKLKDGQEERRKAIITRIAKFTKFKVVDAAHLVNDASAIAGRSAVDFGASEICRLMPKVRIDEAIQDEPIKAIPKLDNAFIAVEDKKIAPKQVVKPARVLSPDLSLQLKILRDLTNGSVKSMNMNTVFQTALEGMHIGIGLERTVLAFFNKDQIEAKYVLGECTQDWRDNFSFNVGIHEGNIFSENIKKSQPVWIDTSYIKTHKHLYSDIISSVVGVQEAFIGVLKLYNRNVVMFYADRSSTGEPLSQEQFESFGHFLTQAELALLSIAVKRPA
jgi:HD-like signal output (HDOD) protein/ribosomal protein L10